VAFAGRLAASEYTGFEFIEIYRASAEGPFHLHPLEIETGSFFPPKWIAAWIQQRPQDFAPGFVECFRILHSANLR
jgi:16S rRNA (adenine1518-N6/adenine1519-N6)-dimethyltransferase